MTDRFKFRVWSKDSSQYIEKECHSCCLFHNGQLDCYNLKDGDCDCIYDNYPEDDLIIEQCTGLKDKNGRLIYEGDIVRVIEKCMTNTLDRNYPMLFNEKTAKFGFKHPDGHFFYFTNNDDFSYEVIGNIHENSDLLENEE